MFVIYSPTSAPLLPPPYTHLDGPKWAGVVRGMFVILLESCDVERGQALSGGCVQCVQIGRVMHHNRVLVKGGGGESQSRIGSGAPIVSSAAREVERVGLMHPSHNPIGGEGPLTTHCRHPIRAGP